MTRFFLDPIYMALLTSESIKTKIWGRFEEEKWSVAKFGILRNAYICLWSSLLLMKFHIWAFLLVFCGIFGFISVFVQFTFITGTCFENLYCSLESISFDFYCVSFYWLLYDVESGSG